MKIRIILAIFLIISFGAFAQVTKEEFEKEMMPLNEKVRSLHLENGRLKFEIMNINSKISTANKTIDSLKTSMLANSSAISQTAKQLGSQIKETGDKNENKITAVSESLSKNSLYAIIGVLSAILISGLLYWLLSKRQLTDRANIIDLLGKTKSSIEGSLVKEFGKQTELMNTQLNLIEQNKAIVHSMPNVEPDHSLALKLASEINLIEKNINLMDSKTKGLKQLQASIGKLKDNLFANGYEMPELLGKQFNQGMKVIVTSTIPDDNLDKDAEVITKVIIPQVNYNDKMIQTAQIETSKGY